MGAFRRSVVSRMATAVEMEAVVGQSVPVPPAPAVTRVSTGSVKEEAC